MHADFLGHPPRWQIAQSYQTDQARQLNLDKGIVANRRVAPGAKDDEGE